MNEPIAIQPAPPVSPNSWWIGSDPAGFTAMACEVMNARVLLDDVSDAEFRVIARRQDVLSMLIGLGQGKQTTGIQHAIVLSRN